jgi:formate hydrogenlyase subunit 4
MNSIGVIVLSALVNITCALVIAPLFEGILRKVTAIVQSRKGPPVLQPFMDLAKLLIKEDIEVGHAPMMQRFSALLALGTMLTVTLFLPIAGVAPAAFGADAILLIYLLSLAGIAVLCAAMAAGSTYSLVGMSREMMSMMTLEPLFAVAIIMSAVKTGSLQLGSVFGGGIYDGGPVSGLCMLGIMLFAFQAFVARAPFDVAEAETEIMEGPLIEYSGPKLAMFKYAHMIKMFVYTGLFLALFVPKFTTGYMVMDAVLFIIGQLVLVLLATLVAATHARYRIDQAIRFYVVLFGLAVAALVAAVMGF